MREGDRLKIGGQDWRVVIGEGHSPEHACLWREADGVVLGGDQILPRISSNVSVWPTETKKWAPNLSVAVCVGTPAQRLKALMEDADITVTN
jgi:glyoxylase-like metal-dependent hydrolase (beta-lactamase superfamily II)